MIRTDFLKHFDLLANRPDAVAKMRTLIFELAGEGRLLGPAIKPVEKIHLGEFAEFVMGQAPAGNECNTNGEGTIFVKAGEFGPLYAEVKCWTTRPLKFAKRGDVLICVVGATVGKLNLAIDSAIGRSVAAIRPSKALRTKFLYYSLMPFVLRLRNSSRGSAQGVIGKDDLGKIRIWIPTTEVQDKVLAKVDELMALCDELEQRQQARQHASGILQQSALHHLLAAREPQIFAAAWQRVRDHFHLLHDSPDAIPQLRQAILQLAVQGRLVPQNPKDERGQKVIERLSRRELPDADHVLNESFPSAWGITSFTNLAQIRSGVTKGRNLAGRKVRAFPYLRVANVQRGFLELDVMKDIEIPVEELDKFRLQPNDLLITEGGDWDKVGRTAIWRGEIADCIHQNHVFRARLVSSELRPEWFMLYFNSPVGRRYFESASKQTTNLASINATELRGCPVPIPPLAEQKRIVARVEELLRWCDTLEAQLHQTRTLGTHLLNSTLHHLLAA